MGWTSAKRSSWIARRTDRKSTRLNSSHLVISYAVFCLKKKQSVAMTIASYQWPTSAQPLSPCTSAAVRSAHSCSSPTSTCARACAPSDSSFFFNDTATTEIYTLSLHDALPICRTRETGEGNGHQSHRRRSRARSNGGRSEEHTSELQSPCNLVCRLLLEKNDAARQGRDRRDAPALDGNAAHARHRLFFL